MKRTNQMARAGVPVARPRLVSQVDYTQEPAILRPVEPRRSWWARFWLWVKS